MSSFTAARMAGELPRRSKPSERLNFARSYLRPRLLDAGLISAVDFNAGHDDGLAGRKWRLSEADLLDRTLACETLSYMLGYNAGELERRSGVDATELAGGHEEER